MNFIYSNIKHLHLFIINIKTVAIRNHKTNINIHHIRLNTNNRSQWLIIIQTNPTINQPLNQSINVKSLIVANILLTRHLLNRNQLIWNSKHPAIYNRHHQPNHQAVQLLFPVAFLLARKNPVLQIIVGRM